MNVRTKFVALSVSEITAVEVLGGVANPNVNREEEAVWESRMVQFERPLLGPP